MLGFLSSGAREFQSSGLDRAKLRGPIHTKRVRGTVKSPRAADRRRHPYRFELTGVSMLDRYGGAFGKALVTSHVMPPSLSGEFIVGYGANTLHTGWQMFSMFYHS